MIWNCEAECMSIKKREQLQTDRFKKTKKDIEDHIEKTIGFRVKVTLVEPKTVPRSEGKAKRIIDNRRM